MTGSPYWSPYSKKLTEHCKPTIMEKIKIIKKNPKNKNKLQMTQKLKI